ncbi:hypothetical protein WMY93_018438 [Mugilogobius chulae]|uniref:G-protein coupled receptors family 1 profile domain-containing protein n=1 Tax=Mugilogobius chulae TaxID=88201 RepID=A0AAW0NN40_9GOBI
MQNSSAVISYFTLGAYSDSGRLKFLYFALLLCTYAAILASNLLLVVVICASRCLHEPMYFLLCSLFLNEVWGSTAVFPMLLVQILRDVHTISVTFCFLQMFLGHSYGSVEFMILAVITYDRYVAISFPLQYCARMSKAKVRFLVAFPWCYAFTLILALLLLTRSLKLCGRVIPKVVCNNYEVVKLSCGDTFAQNVYGLLITFLAVVGPLLFMFVTYARILKLCFSHGSGGTRRKALSTCGPHLASIVNFSFGVCFEVLQSRFEGLHPLKDPADPNLRGTGLAFNAYVNSRLRMYATTRRLATNSVCFLLLLTVFGIPRSTVHRIVHRVTEEVVAIRHKVIYFPNDDLADQASKRQGRFIDIYVGWPGSVHDSRVLRHSPLYQRGLYPPLGHFILADGGYPCLQRPLPLITPLQAASAVWEPSA